MDIYTENPAHGRCDRASNIVYLCGENSSKLKLTSPEKQVMPDTYWSRLHEEARARSYGRLSETHDEIDQFIFRVLQRVKPEDLPL